MAKFLCPVPDCQRANARRKGILTHLRKDHDVPLEYERRADKQGARQMQKQQFRYWCITNGHPATTPFISDEDTAGEGAGDEPEDENEEIAASDDGDDDDEENATGDEAREKEDATGEEADDEADENAKQDDSDESMGSNITVARPPRRGQKAGSAPEEDLGPAAEALLNAVQPAVTPELENGPDAKSAYSQRLT